MEMISISPILKEHLANAINFNDNNLHLEDYGAPISTDIEETLVPFLKKEHQLIPMKNKSLLLFREQKFPTFFTNTTTHRFL